MLGDSFANKPSMQSTQDYKELDATCSFKFDKKQDLRKYVNELMEHFLTMVCETNSKIQFGQYIGNNQQKANYLETLRVEQQSLFRDIKSHNEDNLKTSNIVHVQLLALTNLIKDISVQVPIDEQIMDLLLQNQSEQVEVKQKYQRNHLNLFSDYLQDDDYSKQKVIEQFKEIHYRFIFQDFIQSLDLIKSINIVQYQIGVIDEIDFQTNHEQDFRLLIKLFPYFEKQFEQIIHSIRKQQKYERIQEIKFNQFMQIIHDKYSRKQYNQFDQFGQVNEKTILVLRQLLISKIDQSVIVYIQNQLSESIVQQECMEICNKLVSSQPLKTLELIIKNLMNPQQNIDNAIIYYYLQEDLNVCQVIQSLTNTINTRRSNYQGPIVQSRGIYESSVKIQESLILPNNSFVVDTKLMLIIYDLRKILIQAHTTQQYFNHREKCPDQFLQKFQQLSNVQAQKLITRVNQSNKFFSKNNDEQIQGKLNQFSSSFDRYVELLKLKGVAKSVLEHYYQYNMQQRPKLYQSNEKISDYDQYKYDLEIQNITQSDHLAILTEPTIVYQLDKKFYEDGTTKAKDDFSNVVFQSLKEQFKKDHQNSELSIIFIEILKTLQKKEVTANDKKAIRENWKKEFNQYFQFQGFDSIEQLQIIKSQFQ